MGHSSAAQPGFIGGEWSPFAQGRYDLPLRRQALNLCQNAVVYENGAWGRRSGTAHLGFTNRGLIARLFDFPAQDDNALTIEMTWDGSNSWWRMWNGNVLCTAAAKTIVAVSGSAPANIQVTGHGYSTGDDIVFLTPTTNTTLNGAILVGNVYTITRVDANNFTIADAVTGGTFAATAINLDTMVTNKVAKVVKVQAPYTTLAAFEQVNYCFIPTTGTHNNTDLLLMHLSYAPQRISLVDNVDNSAIFSGQAGSYSFTAAAYAPNDGPYLNVFEPGAATIGAATGSGVSFTVSGTLPNGGAGLTSADVGRSIRVVTEPAQWASGTTYAIQNVVTRGVYPNSSYWTAIASPTVGVPPETDPTEWAPYTPGAWCGWVVITAVGSTSSYTVTVQTGIGGKKLDPVNYGNIVSWEMDLYNAFWGYPSCGVYYDGRVWFGQNNFAEGRFDASAVYDPQFNPGSVWFSPTAQDGTEGDANAISETIADPKPSNIIWFTADVQGLVIGTVNSEWLLNSTTLGEAITPTSIQTRRIGAYGAPGSGNASTYHTTPVRAGSTLVFPDRSTLRMFEFISDTFSGRFTGRYLSENASHFLTSGVARHEYQDSPLPTIWSVTNGFGLYGCTYRRVGFYSSAPPEINAWHQHSLGTAWPVFDIVSGMGASFADQSQNASNNLLNTYALQMVTFDGTYYHVEQMQLPADENLSAVNGWYLDAAPTALRGRDPSLDSSSAAIQFYGLEALNGLTVVAFINGLACGSYAVSNGTVIVPYGSDPEGKLTAANLIAASGTYPWGQPIDVKSGGTRHRVTVNAVIGCSFRSAGQRLRPDLAETAKMPTGDALGLTRRVFRYAAQLYNTGACSFGTNSANIMPAQLASYIGGPLLSASTMFTGVHQDTLYDDPSYDGMLYWQTNSCYPMIVSSVNSFIDTEDR